MLAALEQTLTPLWEIVEPWMPALVGLGIVMAIASTFAIPWLIVRMPADYFTTRRKPDIDRGLIATLVWLLRNALAILLVLAGMVMLVLPGQGLLTILIGVGISTFPGKYRLERAIMRRSAVFRSANWIRRRANRAPLDYPAADNH
ncbi:hypothetical protein S7S_09650 [Isoalcanivorax pacificus W11-5]|uniref:Transmembrane protein (PGPGW) n=1 Tax=Isoalcanivorax pacificus W11-5 TaxID=391936 RepID=A0A0B4XQ07_9GAMM|nr:PGPGW domain-containing protein [Isoalcanivorax pacificus]AJD48342.1 hypothetical protein S7S_09650 [Isoalcanivorax pacificus W11-5]